MAYTLMTIVMCEDDCENCKGRTEAQIDDLASDVSVDAAKERAKTYAEAANMKACELRLEKRDSWYNDFWGWVGTVLLVVLIVVTL